MIDEADAGTVVERSAVRLKPYAWYVLLVLVLVQTLSYIDRSLLAILVADVKRDLHLDNAQVGFLYGTAFAVFYAVFGIPLARLADSWSRTRLIGLGLTIWSAMTAFSGLARNFGELTIARIGVGAGEASANPASYSLVADYFPKERRAFALSLCIAGQYIGNGSSLPVGATIASRWDRAYHVGQAPLGLAGWQVAFLLVGLPGLLLAIWIVSLREPAHNRAQGAGSGPVRNGAFAAFGRELAAAVPPLTLFNMARYPGGLRQNLSLLAAIAAAATALALITHDWLQWTVYGAGIYSVGSWVQQLMRTDQAAWRLTWGTPAFLMLVVAIGGISIIDYAGAFWRSAYLLRTFYSSPEAAGHFLPTVSAREEVSYLGIASATGAVLGVAIGGWLSDSWRRRYVGGRVAVIALSFLLYMPLYGFLYTTRSLALFFIFQPVTAAVAALYWGGLYAAVHEMVLPRMRATASAIAGLAPTMIGIAIGPYVAGKVADVTGSLRAGMLTLYIVAPVVLGLLWLASRRLSVTEATRVQRAGEME